MKVYTDIAKVKAEWDKFNVSDFIHSSFLEVFYINHPKIKHLFVINQDMRLYAHIFELRFDKRFLYIELCWRRIKNQDWHKNCITNYEYKLFFILRRKK